MKQYQVIEGDHRHLALFEDKVSDALAEGYDLAGSLTVIPHASEIRLYQPIILGSDGDWDEEEDEDSDEDSDEESANLRF